VDHIPPQVAWFMAEYNSDPSMLVPGGLAGAPPPEMRRKITLLQRNAGMFKATLSSSAGWILRDNLCRLGVELIARYRCRHDRRVRRSNGLVAELRLRATDLPVHVIGGARHRCHAQRDASDQSGPTACDEIGVNVAEERNISLNWVYGNETPVSLSSLSCESSSGRKKVEEDDGEIQTAQYPILSSLASYNWVQAHTGVAREVPYRPPLKRREISA
jgi:hypothetical protein